VNPVTKALTDIRYKIPREILESAFVTRTFGMFPRPVSLDTQIREQVIDARVLVDMNLIGGHEVEVPLVGVGYEMIDAQSFVMRIPKTLTQNRTISRVVSLGVGTNNYAASTINGQLGYGQYLGAAAQVVASQSAIPMVSTAYVRLIEENTILVTDMIYPTQQLYLRCYLNYDDNLEQLKSTSVHNFVRLCELAVKSYIYNHLTVSLGQGQLSGGQELGRIREIIDSYADAEEMYTEYLRDVMRTVTILDDQRSRERHLKLLMGAR